MGMFDTVALLCPRCNTGRADVQSKSGARCLDFVNWEDASDDLVSGCWYAAPCNHCNSLLYVCKKAESTRCEPNEEEGDSRDVENMQLGGPNHFSVTVASRGVVIRSYRLRKNSVGRPLSEEELKTYTLYSECMRPHERGTYIGIEQVILFDGDAKEALDQYQTIVNQVRIIDSTNLQDKPADIGERLCLQDSYVSFYVDQNIFCF